MRRYSLALPKSRFLPPTSSPTLMVAVMLLAAGCVAIASGWIPQILRDGSLAQALVPAGWLLLAFGLWRLNRAARWVAIALLWLAIIVSTVGIINPETIGSMMRAPSRAASVGMVVARMLVIAGVSLVFLHILGKHRSEFGPRRAPMPADAGDGAPAA